MLNIQKNKSRKNQVLMGNVTEDIFQYSFL